MSFTGEGLVCVRGERPVFAGLDFVLGAAEALVLVGANGSGKTSLLRMMAGLLPPVAGRLSWDGRPIADAAADHAGRIGFVGHADALKPALTTAENLSFWAAYRGGEAEARRPVADRVGRALEAFAIARLAGLPARFLSAGQRKRVGLARLLVADADVWLLDEPRTALDQTAITCLDAAIALHRAGGGRVVMALHGGAHPPGAIVLDLDPFARVALAGC